MKFRQHSDHTNEWMRFLHRQGRQVLIEQLVSTTVVVVVVVMEMMMVKYDDLQSDLLSSTYRSRQLLGLQYNIAFAYRLI